MKAHDFAMQLLAGPNYPILTPRVEKYEEGDEDMPPSAEPTIVEEEGIYLENPCKILVIYPKED